MEARRAPKRSPSRILPEAVIRGAVVGPGLGHSPAASNTIPRVPRIRKSPARGQMSGSQRPTTEHLPLPPVVASRVEAAAWTPPAHLEVVASAAEESRPGEGKESPEASI